jgi:hypothetical protein
MHGKIWADTTMIFDNDTVTRLVTDWQHCNDKLIMQDILLKSQCLVEAIVSQYDKVYREDLIQEALLKLHYACSFYNPEIATLHNFFTTVIHNVCKTYVTKQEREYLLDDNAGDDDDTDVVTELPDMTVTDKLSDEDLTDVIKYMRKRLPSLPVTVIDDCTEMVHCGLKYGESSRNIINNLTRVAVSRSLANTIYNIIVVYYRSHNLSCAIIDESDIDTSELSLLSELKELVGTKTYSKLVVAFSGMILRFP